MSNTKSIKQRLVAALLVLVMMITSLIGTTFAWFTDSVKSEGNKIESGTLKIDLLHKVGDSWISLKENKDHKIFDYDNWEPGYTRVESLKIANVGTLAFKYKLSIEVSEGSEILGENGENLADVIDVYVTNGDSTAANFAEVSGSWTYKGTLAEVMKNPANFISGDLTTDTAEQVMTIALHMSEEAGNEYQALSVGDIFVNLIATQLASESDSFGSDYDTDANFPSKYIQFTAGASINGKVENDTITENVTVGDVNGDIYAAIPSGVKVNNGAKNVKLTVNTLEETGSNVSATHRSQVVNFIDVHIDGIAADNTVPMQITLNGILPTGLNSNNVKLYHVENGETMEMTLVDNPTNHNEFSYDPLTGNAVISIASFSEIVVYGDTKSVWDGITVANGFNEGDGTEDNPYIIANAEQFVYFRDKVDGGETFEEKFIKLTSNIDLNNVNFDPIGWGYEYDGFTAGGKTFNGTFDGDNHIIYGLYQNGWDLDPDKENYSNYTYSMAGGGLFASVVDATIKNLTISGADIVFECVDMGVVCGYAQGNCIFDNIAIVNCTIQNYNRYTGGVVGECSPRYDENGTPLHSNHLFNNIRVDSTTVVSSLWGSFDTSLGGILGGKWDKNGAETKVTMTNCDVACTIDAFNDVTSAYQWYAYRRAGMLIGNTEQSADHKALANFLTCENVHVYYGEWNNYHYCEFENQSGSDNAAWQNNYPWVRVESGLSCGAYSNPRYGHPIVNGTAIVDSVHSHAGDDECMVSLPFSQLYGGGQGVYGATEHAGVSEGAYTVTYINYGETIKVEFVADNSKEHTLWNTEEFIYGESSVIYWTDGEGVRRDTIVAGNKKNFVVYPKFGGELTIRFFDAEGNVLYYEFFKEGTKHELNTTAIEAARVALQNKVDASKKTIKISWSEDLSKIDFKNAKNDITVTAVYSLSTSSITLVPVTVDGVVVSYIVADAVVSGDNVDIDIPSHVGTCEVVTIADGAFSKFDDLEVVRIPTTITTIGKDAFADEQNKEWYQGGTLKYEQITILFEGTYAQWQAITKDDNWDRYIGKGSRIYFLADGTYSEETADNGLWSANDRVWSDPVVGTYQ